MVMGKMTMIIMIKTVMIKMILGQEETADPPLTCYSYAVCLGKRSQSCLPFV